MGTCAVPIRERTFSFDHSFWSHSAEYGCGGASFSNQADVHRVLGKFLLDNAFRGFNCSLFAYGEGQQGLPQPVLDRPWYTNETEASFPRRNRNKILMVALAYDSPCDVTLR